MSARQVFHALGLALVFLTSSAVYAAESKEAQRADVRNSTKTVLKQLYKAQPSARKVVESAPGHAVFSNFGMKILFAGGGSGNGIAIDRETGREVFMKMVEVQAGFGIGVKKFGLVFVFENPQALRQFIDSGWEAGAQTSVAASDGKQGISMQGAISVSPGVWLFQVTDKGLAVEATIKGTKYYKNPDLN